MNKIYSFDNYESSGLSYGGHGGSKKGIIINDERWFLKYPKTTDSMEKVFVSYTTTPISEYIGSHIYESVGLETHKTMLGTSNNKVVVACKDFLNDYEVILDYNMIKNEYDQKIEEEIRNISSSSKNTEDDLEELDIIMNNNIYFQKIPELKMRFWDMFIIDALINNNDRNEGNWGLILNKNTGELRIAPVYDNGAAFYNKIDNDKCLELLTNKKKFNQTAYDSAISKFRKYGKIINPLKYIENMSSSDCNAAIERIVPKIDLIKIKTIFDEIPEKINGIETIRHKQKELYYKVLEYRYNNVLLPTYKKIVK